MYEVQIFCRGWCFKTTHNTFDDAMEMVDIQESFSGTSCYVYRDGVEVYGTYFD